MIAALAIVLGLSAVSIVLLAARVTLIVEVQRTKRLHTRARLIALFGLIDTELKGRGRTRPTKSKRAPGRARPPRLLSAFASEGFLAALVRYLRRLTRAVQVRNLRGKLRVGLEDPADTGMAWGFVGPVHALVIRHFPNLEVTPTFDGARFEIDAHGSVALVPLEVIGVTLAFVLSPPALRMAWALLVQK